tara:strand:+ start:1041 stop:1307 length:267 start_codon:yes stop_codon:yes gene_type:complete
MDGLIKYNCMKGYKQFKLMVRVVINLYLFIFFLPYLVNKLQDDHPQDFPKVARHTNISIGQKWSNEDLGLINYSWLGVSSLAQKYKKE